MSIAPVLAFGDSGARPSPLSRKSFSNQFVKLVGDEKLLAVSAQRLSGLRCAALMVAWMSKDGSPIIELAYPEAEFDERPVELDMVAFTSKVDLIMIPPISPGLIDLEAKVAGGFGLGRLSAQWEITKILHSGDQ